MNTLRDFILLCRLYLAQLITRFAESAKRINEIRRDFITLYKLYRKHHGRVYSAHRAYGIAFTNLPF